MVLFLRNSNNEPIVDCEIYNKTVDDRTYTDVKVSILIETYSKFLLSNLDKKIEIVNVFSYIDELHEWLWHRYYTSKYNDGSDLEDIQKKIKKLFKDVANDYDLIYVED